MTSFFSRWLAAVLFLLSLQAVPSSRLYGQESAAATPPNVVVMIADDMSWDDCGAYGHPTIQTPNIDSLADAGLRFDAAMLTCSSCSPSRCSILTGRYPSATGARELHMPLPADQTMVTVALRKAGYWTVASGKWHLGPHVVEQFDAVLSQNIGPGGSARWLEAIRERPRDQPFFAWLAATDPHRGYSKGTFDPPHDPADSVVPPYLPDNDIVRGDLAMYYDEIARFDLHVGEVVRELDRQGVLENTMLVVMSDNGRPFPRCKTTVYDSGVRTPFVVRLPGVTPNGAATKSLVSVIDLAPTILELAGVAQPDSFQGKSFLPVLRDPQATIREFAISEHNWHDYKATERSVRDDRYRYISNELPELPGTPPADAVRSPTYVNMLQQYADGTLPEVCQGPLLAPRPGEELYDLQVDPHELHNLADEPGYADETQRFRQVVKRWKEEIDDPGTTGGSQDGFHRTKGTRLK